VREQRLDRATYFAAVLEILEQEGCEAVTVARLCERLGVTKGSFYYHFADLGGLVQAFVDDWETNFAVVIANYHAVADRCARIEAAINTTAALSHEAEAALRSWGTTQPVMRAALDRIDTLGEAMIVEAIAEFIPDREQAELLAHHGVSLAVGMQHRQRPIDTARYLEVLAQWARLCLPVVAEVVMTPRGCQVRVTERPTKRPSQAGPAEVIMELDPVSLEPRQAR
jgi:AcrR family transcriptional regulator